MATHNKPHHLDKALETIFRQSPPFDWEVIAAIDGPFPETRQVLDKYASRHTNLKVIEVPSSGRYRNPSVARNVAYREARGEVMILQSDEVQHFRPDTIERLVGDLTEHTMIFANVFNVDEQGNRTETYIGPRRRRPFFFLGSVHRKHVFAIGGNSEDFKEPGFDDNWLGACLMFGRGLTPVYSDSIIGHHLDHPRPPLRKHYRRMNALYLQKCEAAKADPSKWVGGPAWEMVHVA